MTDVTTSQISTEPAPQLPRRVRRKLTLGQKLIIVGVVLAVIGGGFKLFQASETPAQKYASQVRNDVPSLSNRSDNDLVGIAKSLCTVISTSPVTGVGDASAALEKNGITASQASEVIGVAVSTFCPAQRGLLSTQ
jgi:hypothetical protein